MGFVNGQTVVWIGKEYKFVGQSSEWPDCSIVECSSKLETPQLFYVETHILIEQNS